MVQINWNILAQAPDAGQAFAQGFAGGQQMRRQAATENALRAYATNPNDPGAVNALLAVDPRLGLQAQQMSRQLQTETRRRDAGRLYASGDKKGAQAAAVASGDFDLANAFLQLGENEQKAAVAKTRAAAPVLMSAAKLPYEQRRQVIEAAKPTLVAQGWTAEDIDAFDPTDANIEGLASSVMTVEQVLDSGKVKWVTGDWGAFATDAYGRPVQPGFSGGGAGQPPDPQSAPAPAQESQGGIFPAMLQAESRGRQFDATGNPLTSSAGAIGIAQVMPQTAPEAAALAGLPFDDNRYRADPEYNAALGEAYFKKQLADFGDPALAVAAYNAGPARIRQAVEKGGANWQAHIPRETRQYLQNVLGETAGGTQTASLGVDDAGSSLQEQAASGVIRPREKPPAGYMEGPNNSLIPRRGGPGDKTNEREDKRQERITQLRKEFNDDKTVKDFNTARNSMKQIQNLAAMSERLPPDDPKRAQADIALVFQFMKVLDPTSTVREGEYANAKNSAGVPDRIRNQYNQLKTGEFLTPTQRQGFVAAAQESYRGLADTYNEKANQYHGYFRDLGVTDARPYVPIATPPPRSYRRIPKEGGQGARQIKVLSRTPVR